MINDLKTQREWKIELTIAINFIPFKGNNEKPVIHSKSDSI